MPLGKKKLEKLRKVVRLHANWFVASILGEDALSAEERKELQNFKLEPRNLGLVEKSFILGRLKSLFKKKEWKSLSWEEFLELSKKQSLSPLEKLVLQQAKLSAAQHVKTLADDIAAGVFDSLAKATNQAVSEASLKQLIKDEVKLAVLEKKSYQELASSLAQRTKTAVGPKWKMISRTELHAVKTTGTAQAIINRVGVYKKGDGVASMVSIVPSTGTCKDCKRHYLDSKGNPKVFPLSTLMGAGSNADPGVSHKKTHGVHPGWKTTLPPLHPNCRCELLFIPPGFAWVNGKLKMTRPDLVKAIGSTSSGDKTIQAGQNPPALPGVPAPQQSTPAAGSKPGGRPPGSGAGVKVDYIPKDSVKERPPGTIDETEHSYKVIPGAKTGSGEGLTEEQKAAKEQEEHKSAVAWGKESHPHDKVLDHLNNGEFESIKPLGEESVTGVNESYIARIAGNGRALVKPSSTHIRAFEGSGVVNCGEQQVVPGTAHQREKAAYSLHSYFGFENHVPPTSTRNHEGRESSIQSWGEGYSQLGSFVVKAEGKDRGIEGTEEIKKQVRGYNVVKGLLDRAPEDKKEALKQKLSEGAIMQIVMNHGDGHANNIIVNEDFSDIKFIDNSACFGNGMTGLSSSTHKYMHGAGMKVKVPDQLMDRFSKTSYGDIKKATEGLEPREAGQTFLRMRYVQHLQETDGHLDYNKLKGTLVNSAGDILPRPGFGYSSEEFRKDLMDQTLPHDRFEQFALDYLREVKKDPSHADHASVNALLSDTSRDELLMDSETFFNKKVMPFSPKKEESKKEEPWEKRAAANQAAKLPVRGTPKTSVLTDPSSVDSESTGAAKPGVKKSLVLSNPSLPWPS